MITTQLTIEVTNTTIGAYTYLWEELTFSVTTSKNW